MTNENGWKRLWLEDRVLLSRLYGGNHPRNRLKFTTPWAKLLTKTCGETLLPTLLPVGYKVLAWMVQKRLQHGGVEGRIRSTQYGFRPKRSTTQALAVARRIFDAAYAAGSPGIIALLLDWAKAFDGIKIHAMLSALDRFGIPNEMLQLIGSIYKARFFVIKDPCQNSTKRSQMAGVAQGCPLSPYLFILVQTVLLHDVDARLEGHFRDQRHLLEGAPYAICTELLYADDTLFLNSSAAKLKRTWTL